MVDLIMLITGYVGPLLVLLLLARASHWAYHAQRQLKDTNAILREMLQHLRRNGG